MAALDSINPKNTAAILLAAGSATRFGSDKLSADLGGQTVLEKSASAVRRAGCFATAGVIAAGRESLKKILKDNRLTPLENKSAALGVSASIRIGVDWAKTQQADAILIALGDMPFVTSRHFQELIALANNEMRIAYTTCEKERMPPAIFGKIWFDDLSTLSGDHGAKRLLNNAPQQAGLKTDRETLADIDRPEDIV